MYVPMDAKGGWQAFFRLKYYINMRSQASLMTCQELDLVLLGALMTTLHDHVACCIHKPAKRTKISSTFGFLFRIRANHHNYEDN